MTHIIRQQYLHMELNGTESDGLALQRSLPELCLHGLMPAIERALERCSSKISLHSAAWEDAGHGKDHGHALATIPSRFRCAVGRDQC